LVYSNSIIQSYFTGIPAYPIVGFPLHPPAIKGIACNLKLLLVTLPLYIFSIINFSRYKLSGVKLKPVEVICHCVPYTGNGPDSIVRGGYFISFAPPGFVVITNLTLLTPNPSLVFT